MLQECIHYWYIDAEGKGKGDNLFSDFIRECGEGLHHIQFTVDDINVVTEAMNKEGFSTLVSGGFLTVVLLTMTHSVG